MIGIILLITLLIEVELTDRSVDLGDVLPIQTITEDAIINGNGDITVGLSAVSAGGLHPFGE